MSERQTLLELRRLSKAFGGLQVISDLDLHVDEGEIVSIIGPNGAGKTTVFNLITGVFRPDAGDILLDGDSLIGLQSHKITQRGVARTFQTLRLFLNMTVKENVMAAQYGRTRSTVVESVLRLPRARREEREIHRVAEEKLAFFGDRLMGYRWNQPAYSLSYANRRRLEIARACATNPRLLLLDEPAAGGAGARPDVPVGEDEVGLRARGARVRAERRGGRGGLPLLHLVRAAAAARHGLHVAPARGGRGRAVRGVR